MHDVPVIPSDGEWDRRTAGSPHWRHGAGAACSTCCCGDDDVLDTVIADRAGTAREAVVSPSRRAWLPAPAQRYWSRACLGTSPNLPERKSSNAFVISAGVFMTKGPPITTGSPIGRPL